MFRKIWFPTFFVALAGGIAYWAFQVVEKEEGTANKDDRSVPILILAYDDDTEAQGFGENGQISPKVLETIHRLSADAGAWALALHMPVSQRVESGVAERIASYTKTVPLLLSFRITGGDPNAGVPSSIREQHFPVDSIPEPILGQEGYFPPERLIIAATAAGFSDFRPDSSYGRVEMLGAYGGLGVRSLPFVVIEAMVGKKFAYSANRLRIADYSMEIDPQSRVICPYRSIELPEIVPIDLIMNGDSDSDQLRNQLVVIADMRSVAPEIPISPIATGKIAETFARQVGCLWRWAWLGKPPDLILRERKREEEKKLAGEIEKNGGVAPGSESGSDSEGVEPEEPQVPDESSENQ